MESDNAQWEYKPESAEVTASSSGSTFAWTAPEYIEHQRGASWYLMLLFGTAALAAIIYFWSHDNFAIGTIIVLGLIISLWAGKKPRQLSYELADDGLKVGEKIYPYKSFRSFAIYPEGDLNNLSLIPNKRFAPPVSAYFTPGDQDKIMAALGNHLAYEERRPDVIDRLSHRLKF
jgi:hypothetical protein